MKRGVWIVELAWRKGHGKPGWDPDLTAVFDTRAKALANISQADGVGHLLMMRATRYVPELSRKPRKRKVKR